MQGLKFVFLLPVVQHFAAQGTVSYSIILYPTPSGTKITLFWSNRHQRGNCTAPSTHSLDQLIILTAESFRLCKELKFLKLSNNERKTFSRGLGIWKFFEIKICFQLLVKFKEKNCQILYCFPNSTNAQYAIVWQDFFFATKCSRLFIGNS